MIQPSINAALREANHELVGDGRCQFELIPGIEYV